MKTVRLNHLSAALLAVAAAGLAGLLAAVGLVMVLNAKPAEANYPGGHPDEARAEDSQYSGQHRRARADQRE